MEDTWLILRFKRGSVDALCRVYEKYEPRCSPSRSGS